MNIISFAGNLILFFLTGKCIKPIKDSWKDFVEYIRKYWLIPDCRKIKAYHRKRMSGRLKTALYRWKRFAFRVVAFVLLMATMLWWNHTLLFDIFQIFAKERIDMYALSFAQEDNYFDPTEYTVSANTVREPSEKEILADLMDGLFFSRLCTGSVDLITMSDINFVERGMREILTPSMTSVIPSSTEHEAMLQEACRAENNTKKWETEENPDWIVALTDANYAVDSFIKCLSYTDLSSETRNDIIMRIGVIYYFLYRKLGCLDEINRAYRIYFLLCAYACFKIANENINEDTDNFWLRSYYYLGETELQLGLRMEASEEQTDMFEKARINLDFVLDREGEISENLYKAAEKDRATLTGLP